jgi:hypothetical protein
MGLSDGASAGGAIKINAVPIDKHVMIVCALPKSLGKGLCARRGGRKEVRGVR